LVFCPLLMGESGFIFFFVAAGSGSWSLVRCFQGRVILLISIELNWTWSLVFGPWIYLFFLFVRPIF
jgi:hypothetical protein